MNLIRLIRPIGLIGLAGLIFTTAAAALPDNLPPTLRYKASFEGIKAGELEVVITRSDNEYVVDTQDHLSAIAALFTRERYTRTVFGEIDGGRLILLRGHEQFKGDEERREMVIGPDRTWAMLFDGRREVLPAGHEPIVPSFPLILMSTPLDQLANKPVVEIDGKKTRRYLYTTPVQAPLPDEPDINTWKVVRERQDKAGTVTYYLAAEGPPVPLLIEILNSQGRTSRLELIVDS